MDQIYHTTTEDGKYEIGVFHDLKNLYLKINGKTIHKERYKNQTFETLNYEYYVGLADEYYRKILQI